ncbi:MAG: glycerol-3-phosphate 1-O-acyltransferase PlsY [Peptostreptococcus sp.]|uniref:glycerol-3-phosphate 1-O-acyltransferase PlsY n=1 Tax=Peptostreptococcus sp. TaxID=1262 RepID=UPI002FCA944F
MLLLYVLIIVLSYLIGNISSSYIISKAIFGKDIRMQGSKNAGTTNALRTFGFKAGFATFLGDYFKGTIAVLIAMFIARKANLDVDLAKYIATLAVVAGHNWPVLLKFKGGKGVATTYGALLAIAPLPTLASMLFFIVLVLVTRYVSVGSILGVCLFPILMYMRGDLGGVWVCLLLSISVIYKHRENIKRLLKGKESRLDLKKK